MQWEFNAKTQGSRGAKRKAEVLSSKTNHRLVIARDPTLAVKSPRVIAPLLCYLYISHIFTTIFSRKRGRPIRIRFPSAYFAYSAVINLCVALRPLRFHRAAPLR